MIPEILLWLEACSRRVVSQTGKHPVTALVLCMVMRTGGR